MLRARGLRNAGKPIGPPKQPDAAIGLDETLRLEGPQEDDVGIHRDHDGLLEAASDLDPAKLLGMPAAQRRTLQGQPDAPAPEARRIGHGAKPPGEKLPLVDHLPPRPFKGAEQSDIPRLDEKEMAAVTAHMGVDALA